MSEDRFDGNLEFFGGVVNLRATRIVQRTKKFYRIPAIVSRWNPKKQALSVERRVTWLARIRRDDLADDATEFYRDHFISGT